MRKIILELNASMPVEELHSYLKEKMGFPDYYGKNLDALYDCLTDIGRPTAVGLFINDGIAEDTDVLLDNGGFESENTGAEPAQPEGYLQAVRAAFEDAERANENLAVIIGH